MESILTNKERGLVRQWCDACEREYDEKCWQCPLWGLIYGIGKHMSNGWTMTQAFRCFMRLAPTPEQARKTLETVVTGAPLDIARMVLREIEDYEESKV
jgi:hypothetical protein